MQVLQRSSAHTGSACRIYASGTNDDRAQTSRLAELNVAYEILSNQGKREAFDRDLLAAQPELRHGEIGAEGKPHDNILDHEFTEVDDYKQMVQGRRSFGGFDGTLEETDGGSARPVTRIGNQVHYRKWLVLLLLIVVAGGTWLSFRGPGQSARTVSRSEAECVTGTWRTRITLDDSRPELVSTTLAHATASHRMIKMGALISPSLADRMDPILRFVLSRKVLRLVRRG